MAALIFNVELITQRDLLAGLDAVPDRLAVLQSDAAALVQCEFGIDQVAMVPEQPLDPRPSRSRISSSVSSAMMISRSGL